MATSAPLASAGGGRTAVPMIAVMLVGALIAVGSFTMISASREWVNGSKRQTGETGR